MKFIKMKLKKIENKKKLKFKKKMKFEKLKFNRKHINRFLNKCFKKTNEI